MGKSLERECNFEEGGFELGMEYWYEKTSFWYPEEVNSRVVDR